MDGLKALLAKKRQEKADLVGDKKIVRKQDLEVARLKRLREEEEQERFAKVHDVGTARAWSSVELPTSQGAACASTFTW
jgi:hypothetical protein